MTRLPTPTPVGHGTGRPFSTASSLEAPATDHAPLLERLFEMDAEPASYRVEAIEGEIPSYVRGTYYLNGPARFRRADLVYRHWLDGDGRVSALAFDDQGVRFTTRWVESHRHREEEQAGRPLYRAFGTAFEGDRLVHRVGLASPANVSIYPWDGSLLAFGEQGLPWSLDPETLHTLEEETFGRLSPVSPFAAHPHFDPASGEMVNFGLSYAAHRPALHLYRFAPGAGLVERRRLALDLPYSLHDFSLARRWAAFYLAPYLLDMGKLLEQGATVQEALSWEPERTSQLLIVHRETGEPAATIPVGFGYCLHQINAFEIDDGAGGERLVVDLLELPEPAYPQYEPVPDLFTTVPPARPTRLVVDPVRGELIDRQVVPYPLAADFPSIDPRHAGRPYPRFWMLAISATAEPGRKFFDQVVGFDWDAAGVPKVSGTSRNMPPKVPDTSSRKMPDTSENVSDTPGVVGVYQTPPFCYLGGEPVFVGDPEDPSRGVILVQEIDAGRRRGSFLVLDAFDLAAGPLARLPLKEPIPPGFHASFAPEAPRP